MAKAFPALLVLLLGLLTTPADAQFRCFPSCSSNDGRFLVIASGTALVTLSEELLDIELAVPAGTTSFQIGVFDGDSGGDTAGVRNWDLALNIPYSYTLYADPLGDGTGSTIVELAPGQPSISSFAMANNAWTDFTVTAASDAQSPSGNYIYRLRIQLLNNTVPSYNSFKIRTTGVTAIRLSDQPFSYMATLTGAADAAVIYPSFPTLTPTTYDGTFRFFFDLIDPGFDLAVWDGDFDRGNANGTSPDTDDPDTPNAPFLPSWATVDAVPEGVAVGLPPSTGNPQDDSANAVFLRPPTVRSDLLFPDGQTFANENPSGNQEWEQFRISTEPFDATTMDFSTSDIPGGIFELRIQGVDMGNLNAIRLPDRALCVSDTFEPCNPLYPFLVGDTVFLDLDGDGLQAGDGEVGIEGVTLELVGTSGTVAATTTTDADGHYSFNVPAGTFVVRVAASNFEAGNPLEGLVSTTGDEKTDTVVVDNILTYDFGYRGTASLGDYVWYDANGDGVQDAGEAGIADVTLELLSGGGDVLATTVTDADGLYRFENLAPGTYTVRVVTSTLPAGLAETFDLDGIDTADAATATLEPGANRTDVDFGYRGTASLGDQVWNDLDADGVKDAGEAGLNGVTVELVNDGGDVVATTTTSGDGTYSFENLAAGTYTVRIVSATLPAGYVQTYDLDGTGSAHQATATLAGGEERTDVDFGYRNPPTFSVGDRLWNDIDADGVQDVGEAGLNGVTVQLLNSGGTVVATQVTSGDGSYSFTSLAAGTYTVRVVSATLPAGYIQTYDLDGTGSAHQATFSLNASRTDVDFGYRNPATLSVGDRVWSDADGDGVQDGTEAGLNGVTVQLLNSGGTVIATQVTSGNGNYSFVNLAPGTYTVRVVSSTLPANHVQTFDVDGTGSAHQATFNLTASRTDVDFGYRNTAVLSVGDRVWNDVDGDGIQDSGEAGLNGVTVQLLNSGGTVIATQVTSGNGNYTFTGLAPGTYSVRVVSSTLPAGYVQTYDLDGTGTPHQVSGSLTASRADVDFGYKAPTASCTAGYFKDHLDSASFSNNDGTLSWSGSWIEYDVAGTGVSSGNVTVGTPYAGYLFLRDSPDTGTQPSAARQANLTGFATATLSFYFHARTGIDPDDAVVIEVSKDGGANYTVLETLSGFSGTYEGGRSYNISSFIAGNTRIRFRVSANYGASDELFKLDWVKIDAGCGSTTPTTGSIGNRVWKDLDGDGAQDSGEPGLNGVTVKLLNSSGTVLATQVTSGDGNYSFTGLAAATYKVRVESSTLPSGLAPTYDLDGTGTAHIATVALAAGQNRSDADFGYRTPPACAAGYVKDHFSSASFSNNDGSLMWSGSWIEYDTAGAGVSAGNVTVGTPYSGYLFLRDNPDTGTQPSAARQVNLSSFATATLSFYFHVRTAVDPDDAIVIEVSKDGGATYTVLETLKGFSGTYEGSRSYNISSYRASNTRIRFRVSANYGASDELFKLDWVKIDAGCQ